MGEVAFSFSAHAVKRYQERIEPGADVRQALAVLHDSARAAALTGRRVRTGDPEWNVPGPPPMRWVTKGLPGVHLVVTLFGAAEDEEIAIAECLAEEAELRAGAMALRQVAGQDLGRPGSTSATTSAPAERRGSWMTLEQSRLSVEHKRLALARAAVAALSGGPSKSERLAATRAHELELARLKTERHAAAQEAWWTAKVYVRSLLCIEAAELLQRHAPAEAAELLQRLRERLGRMPEWQATMAEEVGDV